MQITVEKKSVAIFGVLIILAFAAYLVSAYTTIPSPGHGADTVVVTVGGAEKNLQVALDNDLCLKTGINCPAALSKQSFDSGWFKVPLNTNPQWTVAGNMQLKYLGAQTYESASGVTVACAQQFQIRDIYPQQVVTARLMINTTATFTDPRTGQRSLYCTTTQSNNQNQDRPYIYCYEPATSTGILCNALPNDNIVRARFYVEALTN